MKVLNHLMHMRLWKKNVIVGIYNFAISLISFYLSLALRFDTFDFSKEIPNTLFLKLLLLCSVTQTLAFSLLKFIEELFVSQVLPI